MSTISLIPGINITKEDINNTINKNKFLDSDSRLRFSSAPWAEKIKSLSISILGLGGIGSYVAYFTSRLGPERLYLYDFDTVESVNMAGQMFSSEDIGLAKTSAVHNLVSKYAEDVRITTGGRITEITNLNSSIVITGFDNMEARRISYTLWKNNLRNSYLTFLRENPKDTKLVEDLKKEYLFIDGRLAAETLQMIVIRGDQEELMKRYEEEFLFSSEDALNLVCSYKQTSHVAGMLGSLITSSIVNHVSNLSSGFDFCPINFFTEFDSQILKFKVDNNGL